MQKSCLWFGFIVLLTFRVQVELSFERDCLKVTGVDLRAVPEKAGPRSPGLKAGKSAESEIIKMVSYRMCLNQRHMHVNMYVCVYIDTCLAIYAQPIHT